MQTTEKRESVIHVQNVFLTNPIKVYIVKETEKYIIGYEPKRHTFHYLLYRIDKSLVANIKFNTENQLKIDRTIDVNVSKKMKEISDKWEFNVKNITVKIIPTKHSNLPQLYGEIYQFSWRKTGSGGHDKLEFIIPECPIISNANTVKNVCYKLIGKQISASGSHQLHTYIIITPSKGEFVIGNHVNISNLNQNGHRNMHIYPVSVTL